MPYCHSTLRPITKEGFSSGALLQLTGRRGHGFPTKLSFSKSEILNQSQNPMAARRMSLSGAQIKISAILKRGKLNLSQPGEIATHILKPIPTQPFENLIDVPANEHLTMQIASQCFKIPTAANALISFSDGEPCYVTRRFDRDADSMPLNQEDFCQLYGKGSTELKEDFKYDGSYEEIGSLLDKYSSSPYVDKMRFFKIVIFNIIFSNGDAHKKNFSLLEYAHNDVRLSPAYDLLCTRLLLPNESRMALNLFADTDETPFFERNGFHGYPDFVEFGKRLGLFIEEIEQTLASFNAKREDVYSLIERSFLSDKSKVLYRDYFNDRLRLLK